jgi:hypothetical protein
VGFCWSSRRGPGWRYRAALGLALAVLAAGLPIAVAVADFTLQDWRYARAIQVPTGLAQEGLVEAPLDREVFNRAAGGLADLRVVEEPTVEVPYHLVVERGRQERRSFPVSIRDLGHVPGQHSSFVADLGRSDVLHNEIEILTSSQNFQRTVTVEGSADGQAWAVLQEASPIFDFTLREAGFTSRHTRVQYPESTARYLRVRIANQGEAPLSLQGALVRSVQDTPARETAYPVDITSQSVDTGRRVSIVVIDLGLGGIPTSRLSVQTSQVNFYRTASLAGSPDGQGWQPLQTSGALYSYDTPRFVGSQLDISYPESTHRYLRLTINNEDNPPLSIEDVNVYGVSRKLLFPARPGASYHLYYGNPRAGAPSYDLERFLPYLDTQGLPVAALGPQRDNPAFVVPLPPLSERLPWLIPLVVGAAALVVGLLLLGVVRQARKILPPPDPQ